MLGKIYRGKLIGRLNMTLTVPDTTINSITKPIVVDRALPALKKPCAFIGFFCARRPPSYLPTERIRRRSDARWLA